MMNSCTLRTMNNLFHYFQEFASPKTLIANAHSVFSSMLRLEDELNKNPEVKIMPT